MALPPRPEYDPEFGQAPEHMPDEPAFRDPPASEVDSDPERGNHLVWVLLAVTITLIFYANW